MNNPTTNDVFDTRDLIEYKEYLESELVDYYNDYLEDHNTNVDEDEQMEEITTFGEVDTALEGFYERYGEEIEEYEAIEQCCEELEQYAPDVLYGEAVINEDYFEEYCKELVKDIGYLPDNLAACIENNIDWEGVADDLRVDYTEIEYNGNNYLVR